MSFCQYWNQTLDGDLASIVLPGSHYSRVLADPFGFKMFSTGEGYSGSGRFVAHFFSYHYIRLSSAFFRWFLHPVESLYMGITMLKFFTHLGLAFLISRIACASLGHKFQMLIAFTFCSALFINGRFSPDFIMIMNSPVYTMYYTLPLLGYFVFFGPMLRFLISGVFRDIGIIQLIGLIMLAVLLPQSSPIQPPLIILSIGSFVFVESILSWRKKDFRTVITILKSSYFKGLIFMIVSSLYAYYLGLFNNENSGATLTLMERYAALGAGLVKYFFKGVIVLPLMVFTLIVSLVNNRSSTAYPLFKLFLFILVLVLTYTLLLPLGGVRDYRPLLIRGDTYILTSALLLLFFVSSIVRWINFDKIGLKSCIFGLFMLGFFYAVDLDGFGKNNCEKRTLHQVYNYKGSEDLILAHQCDVLSWGPMTNRHLAKINTDFLWSMKILDHDFLLLNQ